MCVCVCVCVCDMPIFRVPFPAVFHPSCVDEWLQKWNRTCPLCKSAIQRKRGRGRGGGNNPTPADQERSHLLTHEETEALAEHTAEGRETENYGATGHLDNPLVTVPGGLEPERVEEGGGGRGGEGEQRPTLERSATVTVEIPTPLTLPVDERGASPNLVRNGDTGSPTSHPLEEQA